METLWSRLLAPEHLHRAWLAVRRNASAPGVDRVSVQDFQADLERRLGDIGLRLAEGRYRFSAVMRFRPPDSGENGRPLAILTVADRVVLRAVGSLLAEVVEPQLSPVACGYRPGRSALDAVRAVEQWIRAGRVWILRADVEKFFEHIDHERLFEALAPVVPDEPLRRLIRQALRAQVLDGGALVDPTEGIAQGSPLSPVLSNIYLTPLDRALEGLPVGAVRYSDDICIAAADRETVATARDAVEARLSALGLRLKEAKTWQGRAEEGFTLLGYRFDEHGAGPATQAVEAATARLSQVADTQDVEGLARLARGWLEYFPGGEKALAESLPGLLALCQLSPVGDAAATRRLLTWRAAVVRPATRWVHAQLAQAFAARHETTAAFVDACLCLLRHRGRDDDTARLAVAALSLEPTELKPRVLALLGPGVSADKAQAELPALLADAGQYALAESAERLWLTTNAAAASARGGESLAEAADSPEDVQRFLERFAVRDGVFAEEQIDERGHRSFVTVQRAMRPADVRAHLLGRRTLGAHLFRRDGLVRYLVLDIDVSRKALVAAGGDVERLIGGAHVDAVRLTAVCRDLAIPALLVDSGYKGRHVWIFFDRPVDAGRARALAELLFRRVGAAPDGIRREVFPDRDRPPRDSEGCLIKLPLGVHGKTGRRALPLDADGQPLDDPLAHVIDVATLADARLRTLVAEGTGPGTKAGGDAHRKDLDDLPALNRVLAGCGVLAFVAAKAEATGALTHRERLLVLSALGPLPTNGPLAVRRIMARCFNYKPGVTERFLNRVHEHPISCARIRDSYPELTRQVRCDCALRPPAWAYPTPLLHGFRAADLPVFQARRKSRAAPRGTEPGGPPPAREPAREVGPQFAAAESAACAPAPTEQPARPTTDAREPACPIAPDAERLPAEAAVAAVDEPLPAAADDEAEPLPVETGNAPLLGEADRLVQQLVRLRKQEHGVQQSLARCHEALGRLFDRLDSDRVQVGAGVVVRERTPGGDRFRIEL